jgi:hypothetical protein
MDKSKIDGANCFNCLYILKINEHVDQKELNDQGGIDPITDEEMQRAQRADLITLPRGTKSDINLKRFCNNDRIQMFVTIRMCCSYWDNEAIRRPWNAREPVRQYVDQII